MNEYTGIRFLLAGGSFLQVVMRADEATSIINDWVALSSNDEGEPSRVSKLHYRTPYGEFSWAVDLDSVLAVHLVEIEQLMSQTQVQQPSTQRTYPSPPYQPDANPYSRQRSSGFYREAGA